MDFRLAVNSVAVAFAFGQWQNSIYAGLFAMVVCGFILSCIDYLKFEKKV